jgi:hypothetical protein
MTASRVQQSASSEVAWLLERKADPSLHDSDGKPAA